MILGVIPARGGSKGLPRKNIRLIAGKPLVAWTIEAAKGSRLLDRFIVSTEDREIKDIAKLSGAEILDRPQELATDEASTLSVLQHAIGMMPTDIVVLLQPTSPIRNAGMIDRCIRRFLKTGVDNLATGFICKFMEYGSYENQRRQDIEGFFYDDGNIYVMKAELIRSGRRFGDKVERMVTTREENIEIDDEFDFWLAEQALLRRQKEIRQ